MTKEALFEKGDIFMPLDTLLDLPTKEKQASYTLDPATDDDFELDIRVLAIADKNQPMRLGVSCSNSCDGITCVSACGSCDTCIGQGSCPSSCDGISCPGGIC
jgi:hypothetical protein